MSTTPSGTISLSNVNTALGLSSTATISLNDSNVRFLANQLSGGVDMNTLRNRNYSVGTITVGSSGYKEGTYYGLGIGPAYGEYFGSSTVSVEIYSGQQFTGFLTDVSYYDATRTVYALNGTNESWPGTPTSIRVRVAGGTQYTYTYSPTVSLFGGFISGADVAIFGSGNVGGTYSWQVAY